MRSLKLVSGLFVTGCLIALYATSAQAVPVWQRCIESNVAPEFENNLCPKAGTANKWKWENDLVESEVNINSTAGLIKATDKSLGVGVECETTGEGTVGSAGSASMGKIEKYRLLKCKGTGGCEFLSAEAIHLPWSTELFEPVAGEIRDKLKNGGAGLPGALIECKIIGIKVTDTCEGETSTLAKNETTGGFVELTFEAKSAKLKCTEGGTGSGELSGTDKTILKSGTGLRVH